MLWDKQVMPCELALHEKQLTMGMHCHKMINVLKWCLCLLTSLGNSPSIQHGVAAREMNTPHTLKIFHERLQLWRKQPRKFRPVG